MACRNRNRNEARSASKVTKAFFDVLDRKASSYQDVAHKSQIHANTFSNWRSGRAAATVPNMEDALFVMGLELFIREIPEEPT